MPIDYEAEYDNRARVPEHPEIFARWTRDAEDYRAEAMKERRAELGLSYGSIAAPVHRPVLARPGRHARRWPCSSMAATGARSTRRCSAIWRAASMRTAIAVAVVGYDLCPHVTIAEIIEQIRHACIFLWLRTGQRMMVYGHSAGGHLAGAMVATDWQTLYPKAPADLVPAAYSISGLFDLTPLVGISMNQDLRLDEQSARDASPLFWPAPKGRVFDAVVGGLESSEFLRQSGIIVEAWGKHGTETRYEEIAGTNHFTVIDALTDPQQRHGRTPGRAGEEGSVARKRLDAGLRAAEDQRVDVVRALVGVDGLEIAEHAHHVELVGDAVAAVHVARQPRDLERLAAIVALQQRHRGRRRPALLQQPAERVAPRADPSVISVCMSASFFCTS